MKDSFSKCFFALSGILALVLSGTPVRAGVTIVQEAGPGATNWPGTPIIASVVNPATDITGESFNGGGGNTNLSQTFTVKTTNYLLQGISLYVSGGSGGTFTLNLYDLGTLTAPNPSIYGVNFNLLGSGAGLSVTYTNQVTGILEFDFTDDDQVFLEAGHMYAFEIHGDLGSAPVFWERSTASTYSSGAAYRNRVWIGNSSSRDFALAVYGDVTSQPRPATLCTVDWNTVYQRIDGFGASSAWNGNITSQQATMFFSTNIGIGLSLLRTRIAPDGSTVELNIMKLAQNLGAKVWSTPWSPPVIYKDTNTVNGGNFVASAANCQAYANQLADYVKNMKNNGVNLYALSIQNEPDENNTTYESCVWSAAQFHTFIPYLYNSLSNRGVSSTKIVMPEDEHWQFNLATDTLNDPATAPMASILAAHNYGSSVAAVNSGDKALWETEISLLTGSDSSIANGLYWAGQIHQFLTVAQVNAWHYWWLVAGNTTGNQSLLDTNGSPAKRMYALGNFSKFIRPNFYRIGVTNNTGLLQISAYKDPVTSNYVMVAINPASTPVTQTFSLSNFTGHALTPWTTSSNASLSSGLGVSISQSAFTYTLPAQSIVSFVGQAGHTPSTLTLNNTSLAEGQGIGTTIGTLSATDPDINAVFTYTLVSGAGSDDNSFFTISNATLRAAAVFNYQAQNTFSIRVRTTDQDGLFLENTFAINVTTTNQLPAVPVALAPKDAVEQPLTPVLQASAFSDPDITDIHAGSEWVIRRADNSVLYDTGLDAADKTTFAVSAGLLDYATHYLWQVRYQDNRGAWSGYSVAANFSTTTPALGLVPQTGDLVISWPTNASAFSLQYTTNLGSTWQPVPLPTTISGGHYIFTNTFTNDATFYRLIK